LKIDDTTLAGAISGIIGAICGLTFGLILKGVGLVDRTFHDFAQVFILSKLEPGILSFFIGTLAHFGVGGLCGTINESHTHASQGLRSFRQNPSASLLRYQVKKNTLEPKPNAEISSARLLEHSISYSFLIRR
jgi:hypothetical protein